VIPSVKWHEKSQFIGKISECPFKYYRQLFIPSVIPLGKKVNSQKIINYHCIENWIVFIVYGIYQQTHSIGIPVCNEHRE
jgi:hypothetical protein